MQRQRPPARVPPRRWRTVLSLPRRRDRSETHHRVRAQRPRQAGRAGCAVPQCEGGQATPTGDTAARPHTPIAWNPFLAELTRQLRRREPLSDRQAEFYVRRVAEVARQDEQEREARRVPAPEGTVTFTGMVATIRSHPGYMGRAELKMLVIAEAADSHDEFRVWCTVPRPGEPFGEGDRITLTAELRRSERDPSFAFGKRPRLVAPGGGAR